MLSLTWLVACIGLLSSLYPVSATTTTSVNASQIVTAAPVVTTSVKPTASVNASLIVTAAPVVTTSVKPTASVNASQIIVTASPVVTSINGSDIVTATSIKVSPTSSAMTSTPAISPTPSPKPPPAPECLITILSNYTDPKRKNETCFRLQGCLAVVFTYNNVTNKSSVHNTNVLNLTSSDYKKNESMCGNETAYIIFEVTNSSNVFRLNLTFTANLKKGSQGWKYDNLTLNYTIKDETTFSDFINKSNLYSKNVMAHLNQSLFDEANSRVEFQRPYRCNSTQHIVFADNLNVTAHTFNTTLDVSRLRVQVFEFRKPGVFGVDRYCVFDSSGGSKIVPIVVGAALGALVIIILSAYLISQFVARRKKTTYEPLN